MALGCCYGLGLAFQTQTTGMTKVKEVKEVEEVKVSLEAMFQERWHRQMQTQLLAPLPNHELGTF